MTASQTLLEAPRRWVQRGRSTPDAAAVERLVGALNLPEPLCRLLVLRGHAAESDAKTFLRPRLHGLGDPAALADMDVAIERLVRALDRRETILVHGDYDVDGVCTTALYVRVLRSLGGEVRYFVPRRLEHGYDLTEAGVRAAGAAGASLILTGDCGIVAHDAVAAAAAAGIDVIVTDHHEPGPTLPGAVAVVDPGRADCGAGARVLAGVGVAFKVCQALVAARGGDGAALLEELDLVALATIADVAQLVGENRILTRYGLQVLARTAKPGLAALIRTAGIKDPANVTAGQVSHVIAPRINAIGRMGDASVAVRLLLSGSEAEAAPLATELEEANRLRQATDAEALAEVVDLLERDFDPARDYAVVLASRGWHPGVIGIVAARAVERIHRPVVLCSISEDGSRARGSARSIRDYDIHRGLVACSEHLERFGGHKYAAGMDLRTDRLPAFREALNAHARSVLTPEQLVPEVEVDGGLRLAEATPQFHAYLKHFGPFGAGNPTPVFVARGVTLAAPARTVGQGHLKLELAQDGARLAAIGFRLAERCRDALASPALDVAFQLQEDEWNGRVRLQAKLLDLRPAR
jgi:single-stranded-DNA-specific exonuclease